MSARGRSVRLATRSSDLALRQAGMVRSALEDRRATVEIVEVSTRGDEIRDELIHRLGTTGAFVRALDEEVLDGSVDAAVHSMKDVPTDQPDELVVAGVPERARAGDVLVTPDGTALADLPRGATVGTSSLRRGAQLRSARSGLTVEGLRGNVDTRVEKLLAPHRQREHQARLDAAEAEDEGDGQDGADGRDASNGDGGDSPPFDRTVEQWFDDLSEVERRSLERDVDVAYDAIVLAAAGLDRSGLLHHVHAEPLDPTTFVPAPGQGTLAVTARADSDVADLLFEVLDHPPSRVAATVERTILDELGGGCVAPVGIHARLRGEIVATAVRVQSRDGSEDVAATRELPVESHGEAAVAFASDLADRGARDLIEAARREQPDEAKRGT